MSTMPWRGELLSLDDWDAMPEEDSQRYELVEGSLQVAASPTASHQKAVAQLLGQLLGQLPAEFDALFEMDVLFRGPLAPTVRKPDVVVVPSSVSDTLPARFRAEDVVLAVEVVSPSTGKIDKVAKFSEYADAGIPNYWIIDLEPPASLSSYQLIETDYELDQESAGTVELVRPAALEIDLQALVTSRRP